MICTDCKANKHKVCPGGTWCDCQHAARIPRTLICNPLEPPGMTIGAVAGVRITADTPLDPGQWGPGGVPWNAKPKYSDERGDRMAP